MHTSGWVNLLEYKILHTTQVVLKQQKTFCWAGLVVALVQRCKLEYNQHRCIERCMMQLEVRIESCNHNYIMWHTGTKQIL